MDAVVAAMKRWNETETKERRVQSNASFGGHEKPNDGPKGKSDNNDAD